MHSIWSSEIQIIFDILYLVLSSQFCTTKKWKIGQGLRRLKAKFIDFRPLFEKSDPKNTKKWSYIYNTARESQDKNFSKRCNSSRMPFTPTHRWHRAWTLFEWNPCKDGPHGCSRNSLLVTGFFGNWVFCCWYFSNNWGVSSEIFTPGGAFFFQNFKSTNFN